MPTLGIYCKMGCSASQPVKQTACNDYGFADSSIDYMQSVVTPNHNISQQSCVRTIDNQNDEPGSLSSDHKPNITKKLHQKKVVSSTPIMHSTTNASQSQTDFFKMLDAKIEKGHDAYSETSVT
ncbi:uncharacterized protein LOC117099869 isoform X2 [Anneissia japonica]|uniref:uncharacterized protein LOC117099869 isoform X2 n=1 Tax=Anneissia japonica TaxID=1529436 RepID=UPI00142584F4|nr:uncharacterized protein LOC117099869 isoform X2 [Anneissia japonica]